MSSRTETINGKETETWKCFLPKCKWTFSVEYEPERWSRRLMGGVHGDEKCSKHIRTHWLAYGLARSGPLGKKLVTKIWGTRWK